MLSRSASITLRFQFLRTYPKINFEIGRRTVATSETKSGSPQPIFIEKCKEDPVIVISEGDDVDIIGPPHAVSNLRPIIRKKLLFESELQRQLREMQDATQAWNQEFWALHNMNFFKEKREFIKKLVEKDGTYEPTPEEMSEFYKNFLDKNWECHLRYNLEWYWKNFALLVLAFRVNLEKSLSKMR